MIELIAVLVILAVVSLIVAPLILNTIRNVKTSINMRSVEGYGRAVEYAMANYQLKHLTYPDSFEELDIEYTGNKVECETSRINPDHTIYLSKCKVNGKYVKSDKNKDGYYHYGILKMTNQEYVDTYGKNLEDALKKYYDEHNEYPSDYTTLVLEELDKDVSCDVEVYSSGKVYLTKCSVNKEEILDDNAEDNYYHYGVRIPPAAEYLVKKANSIEITSYTDGDTHEMYTFEHDETVQTPALTDYRYIGNEPYNYVNFNNETWRIIGVFSVDDGTGNYEERIKLIRDDSLVNKQWNSSDENEWVGSTMQVYLNNTYTLDDESSKMIATSKWYLGGRANYTVDGSAFYTSERGESVASHDRSKNWTGNVALMYPSDYIYAYSLGVDNICYNTPGSCNNSIPESGWLYKSAYHRWTLSQFSTKLNMVFFVNAAGNFRDYLVSSSYSVRPVVYLKPNVRIKKGDGSSLKPYELSMN